MIKVPVKISLNVPAPKTSLLSIIELNQSE